MLGFEKISEGISLVRTHSPRKWQCSGLAVSGKDGCVLIDCNFEKDEAAELFEFLGVRVDAYFISHFHLDHANNIKTIEAAGIPIYCPRPEDAFTLELDRFLAANGSYDYGVAPLMSEFIRGGLGFSELDSVNGFDPGDEFRFGDVLIRTVHAPGHSPGHTAFIVDNGSGRPVLFTSDTGLDKMGTWYGFKYCRLDEVRASIDKLEKLYLDGDYILASSHGPVYHEKQPHVFREAAAKIDETEKRLLDLFAPGRPLGLDDISLKGVYYGKSSMDRLDTTGRRLYTFWESGILLNHISELEGKGLLRGAGSGKWMLNSASAKGAGLKADAPHP